MSEQTNHSSDCDTHTNTQVYQLRQEEYPAILSSQEFVHEYIVLFSAHFSRSSPPLSGLSRLSEEQNSSLRRQHKQPRGVKLFILTFTTAAWNHFQSCYCLGFSGTEYIGALTRRAAGSSWCNILDFKLTPKHFLGQHGT